MIDVQLVHGDTMICVHVSCTQNMEKDAFLWICNLKYTRIGSIMLHQHLAPLGPSCMQTLVFQTRLLRDCPPHIGIRIRARLL